VQDKDAVVVTGVSTGIGLAIAEQFLKNGYIVFGSVRRPGDADLLQEKWPSTFHPLIFDVTDEIGAVDAARKVEQILAGRRLAGLINNAGISVAGPLAFQPINQIRNTFEVNVFGLLSVTRAFLPLLGGREGYDGRPGRIINIGSTSGAITVPFMGAYSASKHAVEALTQGLRRELRIYGIHVCAVEPGFIKSNLIQKTVSARPDELYQDSPYASLWRTFSKYLVEQEGTGKSPSLVTRAVIHAIQSDVPRTRYPLDSVWLIGRLLSDRAFDALIFRKIGLRELLTGKKATASAARNV
jgi:NAD(P)-dependent dehydrogenase (short-subunit alcohol dehydrogenase family)